MGSRLEVCGPDDLKVLQQILDSVWLQLQQKGMVRPDDAVSRQRVAASIMSCVGGDVLDVERIKQSVIEQWTRKPPQFGE